MSDDLIKALQKEAQEDAEIITFLRAANEKLNVALDVCRKEANKAADEITRLRAEKEKLREALRPFSWQWDTYGKAHQDDERLVQISVSMRDLRVASSALEGVTEPATGDSNA